MLVVRRMRIEDIPGVLAVERASYDDGWPPTAFERELREKGAGRYVVLEHSAGGGTTLIGFGGLWLGLDEAHVTTVAVEPPRRRQGYGRLLVHALVELAREYRMDSVTLEVRESNRAARELYRRYGFHEVGHRRGYYIRPQEDAVIMTTEPLESDGYREHFARLEAELAGRFPGVVPRVEPEEAAS